MRTFLLFHARVKEDIKNRDRIRSEGSGSAYCVYRRGIESGIKLHSCVTL